MIRANPNLGMILVMLRYLGRLVIGFKKCSSPEAPLGRYWHVKIKIKNNPELRFSTGKESHSIAIDFVKEEMLVSLFKVESGQTVKSRKFKDVAMVCG